MSSCYQTLFATKTAILTAVDGQSYNWLPDKTLDEIQRGFGKILDLINDKLGRLRLTATILMLSDEATDKAYKKLENSYEITAKFISGYFTPTRIRIIVVIVVLLCFPRVLLIIIRMLGYTAKGIVKGSIAAYHMSLYGGQIVSGSLVSILQSIGVIGFGGLQGMFRLSFMAIGSLTRLIF